MTSGSTKDGANNVLCFQSRRAQALEDDGRGLADRGLWSEASLKFQEATTLEPTAQRYAYWARAESLMGDFDLAIDLCIKAIALEPWWGNPYNDIGLYLMKKGELDGAIPWLEKAKAAQEYVTRHDPHINMGRIYLSRLLFGKALEEFDAALNYDPDNEELRLVAERIRTKLRLDAQYS